MDGQRVEIPGSAPPFRSGQRWSSAVEPNQKVSATITLRQRNSSSRGGSSEEELLSGNFPRMSREAATQMLSADPSDVAAVRSFLEQQGLAITKENTAARTLHIEGSAEQMNEAFNVRLGWFQDAEGQRYLSYEGALSVPESIAGMITAVLGLDQKSIAKRHA